MSPGVEQGPGEGALVVGPRGSDARMTVGAGGAVRTFVGPFFAEKGHPLLVLLAALLADFYVTRRTEVK